jgi:hypothetical protein
LICKGCLLDLHTRYNRCPIYRNILVPKEANRLAKNTLAKFMLRYLNPDCNEILKHEVCFNHYLTCQYTSREAQCAGCYILITTTNKLKEIEEHKISPVPFRKNAKFALKYFSLKIWMLIMNSVRKEKLLVLTVMKNFCFSRFLNIG